MHLQDIPQRILVQKSGYQKRGEVVTQSRGNIMPELTRAVSARNSELPFMYHQILAILTEESWEI